jgi:hypothetical protein
MDVLSELEVLEHVLGLVQRIPAERRKVQVGHGLSGEDVGTDHLDQRLSVECEAKHGRQGSEEGQGRGGYSTGQEESPPGKGGTG